jgi:carboxymethylenebutenolidase
MDQIFPTTLDSRVTRRGFVVTGLATGFALAAQPVAAQSVIHTDDQGLTAGEVKIPVTDGTIPAYRAMPQGAKNAPTILVVQEIFGVHEHIKDICRRLAKQGYFAVAPELYARQGDVSKAPDQAAIMAIVGKVPDEQVLKDLDATVAWAKSTGNADTAKLGITGFCWGGRQVWLYAEHNPQVKAGVAWYGILGQPKDDLHPRNPVDQAASLKVPVLGLYGGGDTNIPQPQVEAMRAALPKGNPSKIIVYPDVPHGFHADYRPSYRAEAAQDGDKQMLAWFKQYLG